MRQGSASCRPAKAGGALSSKPVKPEQSMLPFPRRQERYAALRPIHATRGKVHKLSSSSWFGCGQRHA